MRNVMTRVFPLPAPARISTGPSVVSTASRCCGFSSSRNDKREWLPLIGCLNFTRFRSERDWPLSAQPARGLICTNLLLGSREPRSYEQERHPYQLVRVEEH